MKNDNRVFGELTFKPMHSSSLGSMGQAVEKGGFEMDFETQTEFQKRRAKQDEVVLEYANLQIKRFYTLDDKAYVDGALPSKVKELLGLVASLVLRCDDCIRYHLGRCHEEGVNDEEMVEALNVGLVVGGSITIPHLREALQVWHELSK